MTIPFHPTNIVSVMVSQKPSPAPPQILPAVIFEERFEREGRWLLGPRILGSIVRHMKGKSAVAFRNDANTLVIALPEFPKVRNELDGEMVSIYWTIPAELRPIVDRCCLEAMSYRQGDMDIVAEQFIGAQMTDFTIAQANAMITEYELGRQQRADPADPELWKILAGRFGLDWRFLPPEPFRKGPP